MPRGRGHSIYLIKRRPDSASKDEVDFDKYPVDGRSSARQKMSQSFIVGRPKGSKPQNRVSDSLVDSLKMTRAFSSTSMVLVCSGESSSSAKNP